MQIFTSKWLSPLAPKKLDLMGEISENYQVFFVVSGLWIHTHDHTYFSFSIKIVLEQMG